VARKAMRASTAGRLTGRDVVRGTRGLLAETRALRRELRQVPHIVSSFVP
jgi:hypothetical protein